MKKLTCFCLGIFFYVACTKNDSASLNLTPNDAISSARKYFLQNSLTALPNNSKNPRTEAQKEPDWSRAYTLKLNVGETVVVPIRYSKTLYIKSNFGGDRMFALDNLTKLLIYKDRLHAYHAELVTYFPDSIYAEGHPRTFQGIIFVDDWQGNPLRKFNSTVNGVWEYDLKQSTQPGSRRKIVESLIIENCSTIAGYNYAANSPNEGYAWSEDPQCSYTYLDFDNNLPPTSLMDGLGYVAGGGGPPSTVNTASTIVAGNHPITNIQQYTQCFTNIPGFSNTYTVSICVDQPTPGNRTPWNFTGTGSSAAGNVVNVGHTFLVFTQKSVSNTITRNIGFYPSTTVWPGNSSAPGMLNDDETHSYDISLTITITSSQFFQILAAASIGSQSLYEYDLNSNNCTSYALSALAMGGINLPRTTGTWMDGGGYDPGDLGEDIRALNLSSNESRSTANSSHQNTGSCQ